MAYAPRILFSALRNWKRVLPLMRDERVPLALKAGTAALGLLIISPIDVFGDIPVLGLFDDAVLLSLLAAAFVYAARMLTERQAAPRQAAAGLPMVRS
jgi:uncharacterized membrane protein YkvA (DUF1232 family)